MSIAKNPPQTQQLQMEPQRKTRKRTASKQISRNDILTGSSQQVNIKNEKNNAQDKNFFYSQIRNQESEVD
jgi:hypothetical protein